MSYGCRFIYFDWFIYTENQSIYSGKIFNMQESNRFRVRFKIVQHLVVDIIFGLYRLKVFRYIFYGISYTHSCLLKAGIYGTVSEAN
jgi:hypothetical protein